ncbi:hypothetical protein PFISCL1PPCAC_21020, partial [Pristionchus fissidentatus]
IMACTSTLEKMIKSIYDFGAWLILRSIVCLYCFGVFGLIFGINTFTLICALFDTNLLIVIIVIVLDGIGFTSTIALLLRIIAVVITLTAVVAGCITCFIKEIDIASPVIFGTALLMVLILSVIVIGLCCGKDSHHKS